MILIVGLTFSCFKGKYSIYENDILKASDNID
jgi:hypothetical protein